MGKCGQECEVYSRVVGYYRPVSQWNEGKAREFYARKAFKVGAITEAESTKSQPLILKEESMKTSEKLRSLLCNPDGKVCIIGTDKDSELIEEALVEVEEMERKQAPRFESDNISECLDDVGAMRT